MRTVTLLDVLNDICAEWRGETYTAMLSATGAATLVAKLQSKLNTAYEMAWEYYDWPETLGSEERTPDSRLIAHSQTGKDTIHLMIDITNRDPDLISTAGIVSLPYRETDDGWLLLRDVTPVWCQYQKQPPTFGLTAHVQASTFTAGTRVLSGGNSYVALQDVPADTVITNTSYWAIIPFLYLLRMPVVTGVIGALTRADGQDQTGEIRIGDMSAQLEAKIMNLTDRSGRVKHIKRIA